MKCDELELVFASLVSDGTTLEAHIHLADDGRCTDGICRLASILERTPTTIVVAAHSIDRKRSCM